MAAVWLLALSTMLIGSAYGGNQSPSGTLLVSGLQNGTGSGSAIGPDGALYVTEGVAGRIARVDLASGEVTMFAEGLPAAIFSVGGPMDVAFLDGTAYALVTLVGPFLGGTDVVGIYRIDGQDSNSVIADIGSWSAANPPPNNSDYFVPSGVQYSMQPFRGGFLVTDGHHGRVLYVTLDGDIREVVGFGDIVPTGLETRGNRVYITQAGPVPHLPEDGKVLSIGFGAGTAAEITNGVRLAVDVELGPGNVLYALSQGVFTPGNPEGSPANPDTGALYRVNEAGVIDLVFESLDRPTSLEIVGQKAYVVTLGGEVWQIDNAAHPHG